MRIVILLALLTAPLFGWGARAHQEINRAAVNGMGDELAFLKAQADWIVYLSVIPDTYRLPMEPFLKIFEDPNHGWFLEQSRELMTKPPRSRYEFIVQLYDEHKRTKDKLTNVRWTGTLPYAAMEHYERVKTAMRRLRMARAAKQDTVFLEREIATYVGLLGHYTGDGAQPLHDTIHHNGWLGENPKGYTTESRVHGRVESEYVELIEAKAADFEKLLGEPAVLTDPFQAIVDTVLASFRQVERVYQIELEKGWTSKEHEGAREVTYGQLAAGARLLRDLVHTAWVKSAEMPQWDRRSSPNDPQNPGNPLSPQNPRYNPATGSAPAGN